MKTETKHAPGLFISDLWRFFLFDPSSFYKNSCTPHDIDAHRATESRRYRGKGESIANAAAWNGAAKI